MNKWLVLYNPYAGNDRGEARAKKLKDIFPEAVLRFEDVTSVKDYNKLFSQLEENENIIIVGGDGTLNHFANDTLDITLPCDVYFFSAGTGNDFLNDIGADKTKPVLINKYLENLPEVEINGEKYKFINGIGFGIDGYCCEEGDKIRAAGKHKVNYTAIAIKGFVGGYKRVNAKITVDGKTYTYKKVWVAPTMNGRYYGGGMMATPTQDRLNPEHTVTVSPMYGKGKLKTLMVFPSIFKGEHIKHTDMVDIHSGHEIEVEFDRPTALQVDGETFTGITKYKVSAVHNK